MTDPSNVVAAVMNLPAGSVPPKDAVAAIGAYSIWVNHPDLREELLEDGAGDVDIDRLTEILRLAGIEVPWPVHEHSWHPEPPAWDYRFSQAGGRTCTDCGKTIYD